MKEKAEKKAEERRRVIADFMKHPENWERVGSTIERPASGKKFNTNSSQIKKRDYVIGQNLISSLEHSILGTLLNDESEPLHILYKDALSEFQNVNFASFIEALVNLFNLGYVETRIEDIGEPIKKLTKDGLISHYRGGLSDRELEIYPDVVDYYFRVTPEGKEEEGKDIYNEYYPD